MSYQDEVSALSCFLTLGDAAEIAARADAEIAALKRSCEDWESQMRTFRETENAEIAELRRELVRLQVGHDRYETVRRMSTRAISDSRTLEMMTGKPFDEIVDELRPFMFPVDAARGGE